MLCSLVRSKRIKGMLAVYFFRFHMKTKSEPSFGNPGLSFEERVTMTGPTKEGRKSSMLNLCQTISSIKFHPQVENTTLHFQSDQETFE